MSEFLETDDRRAVLKNKLRQYFDGKIVRKDLTKKIKEGANVPVYVLEFLLGQYCSSDDPEVIEQGVENVKRILADVSLWGEDLNKIFDDLAVIVYGRLQTIREFGARKTVEELMKQM